MSPLKRGLIYERDGWRCVQCGSTDDLTLDHVRPRSKGGTNHYGNLQTLCGPCNRRKSNQ